jgi:hypothetical protein
MRISFIDSLNTLINYLVIINVIILVTTAIKIIFTENPVSSLPAKFSAVTWASQKPGCRRAQVGWEAAERDSPTRS